MWWNDYVGLPYLPYGRDRSGCDCWGLVRLVQQEVFGREFPSFVGDYSSPDDRKSVACAIGGNMAHWVPTTLCMARGGDVVLLLIGGFPCHVGVVTRPGFMLHISKGINATIEPYNTFRWSNRVEGVYRYAGPR